MENKTKQKTIVLELETWKILQTIKMNEELSTFEDVIKLLLKRNNYIK